MNINDAPFQLRIKVGLFTLAGLSLLMYLTLMINDRPDYLRGCNLVHVTIQDATGLKTKSPVRSLGIQIGYLKSIQLLEDKVRVGICITSPVEVLPTTQAHIKSEGFLGDKVIELKPVKSKIGEKDVWLDLRKIENKIESLIFPSAYAAPPTKLEIKPALREDADDATSRLVRKEIPAAEQGKDIQEMMKEVNSMVQDLNQVTKGLKGAIKADELRDTMQKLNKTLEGASATLSPEGGLTKTAQKALVKLDEAIEQARDAMIRINEGKGSVGKILNDPAYADELMRALKNLNRALSRYAGLRLVVDVGAQYLGGYAGSRGWFLLSLWPKTDRYYLVGLSSDSRGKVSATTTTTVVGATSTTATTTSVETGGLVITVMMGKIFFKRLDLSLGILHGDAGGSISALLGHDGYEDRLQIRNDLYFAYDGTNTNKVLKYRPRVIWYPSGSPYLDNVYLTAGLEDFRPVNGVIPYFVGAGISFDDEDIKLLLSLR